MPAGRFSEWKGEKGGQQHLATGESCRPLLSLCLGPVDERWLPTLVPFYGRDFYAIA